MTLQSCGGALCRPRCPNGLPLEVTHLGTDRGISGLLLGNGLVNILDYGLENRLDYGLGNRLDYGLVLKTVLSITTISN